MMPMAATASSISPAASLGRLWRRPVGVHARRPFFVLADLAENARRKAQGKKSAVISPLALETVRRIDALFEIERAINGQTPEKRKAVRQELSAPLVADLEAWMREQRAKLSRGNDVAKAMDYMLKRWAAFTRFLEDGRICLSNNVAERGVPGIALGRKSWLFCGSDRGGQRAALMYSLIVMAKMNDVDPQAWLADVLARIAEHPVQRLDELLALGGPTSTSGPVRRPDKLLCASNPAALPHRMLTPQAMRPPKERNGPLKQGHRRKVSRRCFGERPRYFPPFVTMKPGKVTQNSGGL
jgi:hypothetical protein